MADVLESTAFGFGKSAAPEGYPAIYVVGLYKGVYGIWQPDDNARSFTTIGDYPTGNMSQARSITGDMNVHGRVYIGFSNGYAYWSNHYL